jgi:hypothetical protein
MFPATLFWVATPRFRTTAIDDDIVTADTHTDEEIVREMRSKDGKEAEEPEEEERVELSIPL